MTKVSLFSRQRWTFFSSQSSVLLGGTLHTCPPITGPGASDKTSVPGLAADTCRGVSYAHDDDQGADDIHSRTDTFFTIHGETDKIPRMSAISQSCIRSSPPSSACRSGRPPRYHPPSCPCQATTPTLTYNVPSSTCVFPRMQTSFGHGMLERHQL